MWMDFFRPLMQNLELDDQTDQSMGDEICDGIKPGRGTQRAKFVEGFLRLTVILANSNRKLRFNRFL
jgi:hypothetical protein